LSQENVEAFLAGVDAINRADADGLLGLATDDVVVAALRSAIAGDYCGHAGLRTFLADNEETFELFRASYEDVRDLGDRVLALGKIHVRVRAGQLETDLTSAGVAVFCDGKLARWTDYGDRKAALEAVGLQK
jgi:ketosteroid isomerase-like protein